LVGESGCGKSTIVQLLLRYYDVDQGQLQINDRNIKELDMDDFRRKIGFVGQ
jgi:ABC-type multidrug transport system fused ATPase/permease subunit